MKIQNVSDAIAREDVMAALDSFLKAEIQK
jgi:hypothetical protein